MSIRRAHLRVIKADETASAAATSLDLDDAFRQYAPYVARIALRILGDPAEVEDIVQDVFLIGYQGIEKLRDPKALKSWLATITLRQVNKRLRWRQLRKIVGYDRQPDRSNILGSQASSADQTLLVEVYRILEAMPAKDRIAWVLRHVEGENLDEIAKICGCSRATAHRRVARAKATLQEALEDGGK